MAIKTAPRSGQKMSYEAYLEIASETQIMEGYHQKCAARMKRCIIPWSIKRKKQSCFFV